MTPGIESRSRRMTGTPLCITNDSGVSMPLERIQVGQATHSEAWLQRLAFDHPAVLPIGDIEPGLGTIYPIALEVGCSAGFIDALYITGEGDIVIVEAKLWRNPQARREVVAQVLDYVAALSAMTFEEFEAACLKGRGMRSTTLYGQVADKADALPEDEFVDAVARNLTRGRMLAIALGDGIRAEAQSLAGLLQSHAGAHFTFALVELVLWRHPETGDLIALPGTLAQTVMITRGIVGVEEGKPVFKLAPVAATTATGTISGELYFEELAKTDPGYPALLREFVSRVEPLGVYVDQKASMNLKVEVAGYERPFNLAYITKRGKVWTDAFSWNNSRTIAERYNEILAQAIGGSVSQLSSGSYYVSTNGKSAPVLSDLLPQHLETWVEAIAMAVAALRQDAMVYAEGERSAHSQDLEGVSYNRRK